MTTPEFNETVIEPLTTDALIQKRVGELIGKACRRQLWFVFLDADCVQLPLLIPMDGLPGRPTHLIDNLGMAISQTMQAMDARSVVVVIERYAGEQLSKADLAWALAIHECFDRCSVSLRGILLSHRGGVRWVAQDDYRFG